MLKTKRTHRVTAAVKKIEEMAAQKWSETEDDVVKTASTNRNIFFFNN